MKKRLPFLLFALLVLPYLAYAGGGGGLEYLTNIGPDLLPSVSSGKLVSMPSGSIAGLSGFGYGLTSSGWKIGGFGLFIYTNDVSVPVPGFVYPVTEALAWYGGLISGGQARLGPFSLSLNLRLGAGMAFADMLPAPSLYGSLDGELGLLFVPAMLISAYLGVGCIAPIIPAYGPVPIASVIAGVRLTWGSF